MRLERLEVTGFGRLRQRRFDFGERITVVLGPNESGKSTLHRAIRAALYGLDAGGPGRPRERSDWARWLPWAPGRFGVTLTYTWTEGAASAWPRASTTTGCRPRSTSWAGPT